MGLRMWQGCSAARRRCRGRRHPGSNAFPIGFPVAYRLRPPRHSGESRNPGICCGTKPNAILTPQAHHSGESRNPATRMKQPCVYILASKRNGTLYLGVTSNLMQRVWQHKTILRRVLRSVTGFTPSSGTSCTALCNLQLHERKPSRSGSVLGRLS